MHSLMVQLLSGVQNACSWVQSEFPQAERISAAKECKGQFVLLISVHSADLQDFSTRWFVFRHIYLIITLRELGPVVVSVNDTNEHLKERNKRVGNIEFMTSDLSSHMVNNIYESC